MLCLLAYRRGFDDGDGLHDLLLVHLGAGTLEVADDGGHAGLVAHGGREVDRLLGVIIGEATPASQYRSRSQKNIESILN